jgi:hypothetical protein
MHNEPGNLLRFVEGKGAGSSPVRDRQIQFGRPITQASRHKGGVALAEHGSGARAHPAIRPYGAWISTTATFPYWIEELFRMLAKFIQ